VFGRLATTGPPSLSPVEPTSAATRCVRGWVRSALVAEAGGVVEPATSAPLPPRPEAVAAVVRQRVVELVHVQAAVLGLPDELVEELGQIRSATRSLVPLQLIELSAVRRLLEDLDVPHLVFKGPALAVQTTGDVGARGFGDLDVLVDPRSVERVATELLARGWSSAEPLPSPGSWAWRRTVQSGHELPFIGASCSVDLHWRLDPTLDALPSFPVLWERREVVELGGSPTPTLGRRDALSHACLNARKDRWRWLRSLVDIHRLARLDGAWEAFEPGRLELAALALADAQVGLPDGLPAAVRDSIARLSPRALDRLISSAQRAQVQPVRTRQDAHGSATRQILRYQLVASRSPRDVRRAAGALLLPGRSVAGVDATSAWTGVPVGLGIRVGGLVRRAAGRMR